MTAKKIAGVTIAIPTFNRSSLLEMSLKSALSQTHADMEILVLDNASIDDTAAIVNKLSDSRVKYIRHRENIGLYRNWNFAIRHNKSPYLAILQDDDLLLPEFVSESISALEDCPEAAYSFAIAKGIDTGNQSVPLPGDFPPVGGKMSGLDLLHQFAAGANWVIRPSTVMMRLSALEKVGSFDTVHSKLNIDLNLYLRMAARYDVIFVPETLALNRVHEGQQTEQNFRAPGGVGPIGALAERTDAIAYLLGSTRSEEPGYRSWLADRLIDISLRRSEMTSLAIPDLNLSWEEKAELVKEEIELLVPSGVDFVFMDNDELGEDFVSGRKAIPLMRCAGVSFGAPPDDTTAIEELGKLHRAGVNLVLIAWPAFWWLDYYSGLRDHLRSRYTCVFRNSRLVAYCLR